MTLYRILRGQWVGVMVLGALLLSSCVAPGPAPTTHAESASSNETTLPTLSPIALDGRKLRVVVTTNVLGDVVSQVGGDRIDLTTLLAPGVDPHAYQLAPADRQRLEDADVVLINGLGLEEGMLPVLAELAAPVVAVSAGITTLEFGDHEDEEHVDEEHADEEHEGEADASEADPHETEAGDAHHHEGADPHVWQSVPNVMVWTANIATVLSALDPAQTAAYAAAAAAYQDALAALDTELRAMVEPLPAPQRKFVTDHDSLGYLAHEYGFTVIGAVIPSLSTSAAASAQELAALEAQIRQEGVKAIFVGTTVNPQLASQLAADLGIAVVPIYTDSLSDASGPAANYIDFMRHNMQTIVAAIQ